MTNRATERTDQSASLAAKRHVRSMPLRLPEAVDREFVLVQPASGRAGRSCSRESMEGNTKARAESPRIVRIGKAYSDSPVVRLPEYASLMWNMTINEP